MKTITKKLLSILLAVIVLAGGIGISLAIEPVADNIAYDTTIDFSTVANDNYGAWNYNKLGAEDINRQGNNFFICKESSSRPGLNVSYGGLGVEWGSIGDAYLIYKVASGTKFEATFALIGDDVRTRWATNNNAEFEFKLEASASKDGGWKNAVDTKGMSGDDLYAHGGSHIENIVLTYDVPEDCEYVKITFPQKGILPGTSDTRLNDFGYLTKIRYFKVKPAPVIKYDTTFDYTTSEFNDNYGAWNYTKLGAVSNAEGGSSTYMLNKWDGHAGVSPQYGVLAVTWGTANPYLIYKVAGGTKFEATFALIGNDKRTDWKTNNNAEFEFKIEASNAVGSGWKNAVDTTGLTGTALYAHAGSNIEKIVVTYDVPEDCEYVKITFPQKGILPGTTDTRLNDFAYLAGVKMFKVKPVEYDAIYDYSPKTLTGTLTNSNKAEYGVYAINSDNSYALSFKAGGNNEYDGGLGIGWGDLANEWGTKNKAFVVYKVKAGTKFQATFRMLSGRTSHVANAGTALEATIEASANGTGGWTNLVDTAGKEGTAVGGYTDYVITYDVPADCNYVKITLPQQGTIPNTSYRGNDLARIMGVKYFKYAAPAVEYDTIKDYSTGNKDAEITNANKDGYGIYALNTDNAHKLYANVQVGGSAAPYSGGIGGGWSDLGTEWGTKNAPYVIYKVKEGTKFEATFRTMGVNSRNNYSTSTGELIEAVIEASANGVDGWTNTVTTKDKAGVAAGPYEDVTITYDVPANCNYVKITLPLKGIFPGTTYRGNDLIRIMGVKYSKYAEQGPDYTKVYDYTYANATVTTITNSNKAAYGIYALNTDNAHKLSVPTQIGGDGAIYSGGIGGDYGDLGVAWGTKNKPYAIYKVEAGTKFEATLRMVSHRSSYTTNVGAALEATIEASVNGVDGWTNLVDTAGKQGTAVGGYTDYVITYDVPADCNYVKITLPMQGIIPGTTYRGNDLARIMGVKYFGYVAPTPTYDRTYDYSDPAAKTVPVNGSNISTYGIYAYNNSAKAPALYLNEGIGNEWRGGIHPGYGGLGLPWGEVEKPFVIYEVKPGTFFEITARMISNKDSYQDKTGEPFEFTVEASSNDMTGWKNKVDTASVSGSAVGGYNDYVLTYEVPADCSYVKVTFPQQGVIPGTNYRGNDGARLMKVRLNAAKNFYEGTDTTMNYKANGEVDFYYDNDAALIYLYRYNGIEIKNFSNGAAYVAPSMSYLNSGSNIAKPYVVYAVESGTKFVASFNVNRDALQTLGADFAIKIYESTNAADWELATTTVESVGDIDYHTFTVSATSKYVKIEYPHTDAVKAVDNIKEVFGLMAIGFNPEESAYAITNPYGNYTFKNVDKFYGDAFSAQFNVLDYNIYKDFGGVFVYEASQGNPYYYLAYGYGNLINNEGADLCGLSYNVVPGTAFQAVALLSRNNNDVQTVEKVTGEHFDIIVQVSSDGKNWTDYNPSRILTDKHLAEGTLARYVTEVITIPVVPADVKFVRLMYPQTASVKVMTGGVDNRAGNDFIGLAQVSFTKGNAVPEHLYDPDRSQYEDIYDFSANTYNIEALNPTGLVYDTGLGALSPSWGYFDNTNKAIREKCAVTISVKEGTAFYVDFGYRPDRVKLMEGENYSVKLLFSSDGNNWTDVTEKYIQQVPLAGILTYGHRFEIAKLPAGVKYVKVEYPHDRDMRGYVTALGKEVTVLGNDNCGIRKLFFTADEHTNYKHEIRYGFVYEEYQDFPEDIDEDTAPVLGLYDYTKNAFAVADYTDADAYDGRIYIKESFIFNKTKVDPIYLTYNVVPGTEFYMSVSTSATGARVNLMAGKRFKIYASETGKDGSWSEITNFLFTDRGTNQLTTYYISNVGAKTNFIKVVFPVEGDLVAMGLSEGASGASFYQIKEVRATLVNYNPSWEEKKEEHNFKKPELNNKVESGTVEVVTTVINWKFINMMVVIGAAAFVLVAGAVVTIILIKKKKKKAAADKQ